ncbi:MAG: cytochrome c biogenesis protein CcdA [Synechococcaceae cyanobacterium]
MTSLALPLAEWARSSEQILQSSLAHPGPLTVAFVFGGGLLTSLGPCSLSLLPVTLAYLAGFSNAEPLAGASSESRSAAQAPLPWQRSLAFTVGIVLSLVLLGLASGWMGRLYGSVPGVVPLLVALVACLMGLQLLGLLRIPLPAGPDPERWRRFVPAPLAPLAAGLAFGLAATPCTTPVLAVLLAWMAQNGRPLVGMLLLTAFGAGQVLPLLLAGTAAASLPTLLQLRRLGQWVPPLSGVVLLTSGALTPLAHLP